MASPLRWRRRWLATAWLLVISVMYLSLMPVTPDSEIEGGDKLAHVIAYAVLMFWFVQIYAATTPRLVTAAALVLMGIALEYLQAYTGRSFEHGDMIANLAVVILGWLAAPPRVPNVFARIERAI